MIPGAVRSATDYGMIRSSFGYGRARHLRDGNPSPESVVASGGTEGSAENSRVHHFSHSLAREALMMAGAGGAVRATGWRATAIRFQQFGEGSHGHRPDAMHLIIIPGYLQPKILAHLK